MEARVEFELELEPDKNKNEPSSNEGYSLKIGSITPLVLHLQPMKMQIDMRSDGGKRNSIQEQSL